MPCREIFIQESEAYCIMIYVVFTMNLAINFEKKVKFQTFKKK